MESKKEDADTRNKRYLKGDAKVKQPTLSAKRLFKNRKCRERQRLKNVACLTVNQGAVAAAGTSYETLPNTSAADNFPTDRIYEEDAGNFEDVPIIEEIIEEVYFDTDKEEIVEEVYFDTDEEEIIEEVNFDKDEEVLKSVPEDNELPVSDEIPSVTDINEETNEDVGSNADYWVVENAESEQPKNPVLEGIDFVDFPRDFEQIKNLEKHSNTGCGIKHFEIVRCQRNGLENVYYVECKMCKYTERISCLRKSDTTMDINRAAVATTMMADSGSRDAVVSRRQVHVRHPVYGDCRYRYHLLVVGLFQPNLKLISLISHHACNIS
ncbi:uncharacterized protein LOC143370500 [Andrena cerasifolii]|uniref:uncharacterized protein LOC143370500 n=1 Tax=Andrena cerasifolii TaxID=2819439 RepID=UPI004038188B